MPHSSSRGEEERPKARVAHCQVDWEIQSADAAPVMAQALPGTPNRTASRPPAQAPSGAVEPMALECGSTTRPRRSRVVKIRSRSTSERCLGNRLHEAFAFAIADGDPAKSAVLLGPHLHPQGLALDHRPLLELGLLVGLELPHHSGLVDGDGAVQRGSLEALVQGRPLPRDLGLECDPANGPIAQRFGLGPHLWVGLLLLRILQCLQGFVLCEFTDDLGRAAKLLL
mmetsp:Transcript_30617/g.71203  ORF Transcript_30617/g.71203 Transcript_30617/m.71203 type:complete len:227 (+) Transcript_30617:140-820(+)